MRSHLLRGLAALAFAALVGAVAPVGRDRLGGSSPAAAGLSVETGARAAAGSTVSVEPAGTSSAGAETNSGPNSSSAGAGESAILANDPTGARQDRDLRFRQPQLAPPPGELAGYVWPIAHGRITQPFGFSPFGTLLVGGRTFHDGLDIASFCGDHVLAAHDGVVLAAGRRSDPELGWLGSLDAYHQRLDRKQLWGGLAIIVVIDDGNGYRSLYAHLNLAIVRPGQTIHAGEMLGYEGATGFASGCHLHYGLFSPLETATMELDPKIARKTHLPLGEIARIDPLLVLPAR